MNIPLDKTIKMKIEITNRQMPTNAQISQLSNKDICLFQNLRDKPEEASVMESTLYVYYEVPNFADECLIVVYCSKSIQSVMCDYLISECI